jgi:hypothetical protein
VRLGRQIAELDSLETQSFNASAGMFSTPSLLVQFLSWNMRSGS